MNSVSGGFFVRMRAVSGVLVLGLAGGLGAGCGTALDFQSGAQPGPADDAPGNGEVVQVRAEIPLVLDSATGRLSVGRSSLLASGGSPISVTVAPSVRFDVDDSDLVAPVELGEGRVSFGHFAVDDLYDNNLRVCGVSGHQKCTVARLRMYTTGSTQAGLVNSVDGYGIPIYSGVGTASGELGVDSAGALVVEEVSIAAGKNVLRLSDLPQPLEFPVEADFSNAGAGAYTATLVLEYVLSLN